MSKINKRDFRQDLFNNAGAIYLPNGEWWHPEQALLRVFEDDIWSYNKQELIHPNFEQDFSVMIESAVIRGDCLPSDDGRAGFVFEHLGSRAKGEFFDWRDIYFDRDKNVSDERDTENKIEPALGEDPGRTMTRLKSKIENPSVKRGQCRNIFRNCCYAWVWKCYAARAGRPEFCEDHVR